MSDTPENMAERMAEPFEGFSAKVYLDTLASPPVWTQGLGSTTVNGDGVTRLTADSPDIDLPTARVWMANEMRRVQRQIVKDVKVVLTDKQLAALDDLVYNIGIGAFESSTLLRKLNAGDYDGAAFEIIKWDHAGGKEVWGLLRRRMAELNLYKGVSDVG